jgi:hypothetical protein
LDILAEVLKALLARLTQCLARFIHPRDCALGTVQTVMPSQAVTTEEHLLLRTE